MNAYEKAQSLGLTGIDAEQVAVLRTIANTDISRTDLASWLARQGLLDFDGNTWFGLLQDKIDDNTITGPLLLRIKQLKSVVLSVGGESLRTTAPPYCVQVFAGLSGIAAAVPAAAALCAEFYDVLGGGRPYNDLTVEQFATLRSDYNQSVSEAANRVTLNALSDGKLATIQARHAEAKAAIEAGTVTTAAQVNAIFDRV